MADPVLRLTDVTVRFGRTVTAVDHVSLSVAAGETLGLVGESGSGKSTVSRVAVGVQRATEGTVWIDGTAVSGKRRPATRRAVQMVFQDPTGSFDRRQRVGAAIAEPLVIHRLRTRRELEPEVDRLLGLVGLGPELKARYPHQLSGGQRQRVAIARAMALTPRLIVCDEPVSALDVSVQAQIINQLVDLQRDSGVAYLFVAHDLAVVRHVAHRVAIMFRGRVVETGPAEAVYDQPRHPYTVALLDSVLDPARPRRQAPEVVDVVEAPVVDERGCAFRDRCTLHRRLGRPERCVTETPVPLADAAATGAHLSECHYPETVAP